MVALENTLLQDAIEVERRLIYDVGKHFMCLSFDYKTHSHSLGADARGVDFRERIFLLEGGNESLRRLRFHRGVENNPTFLLGAVDDRLGASPAGDQQKSQETDYAEPNCSELHANVPLAGSPTVSFVNGPRINIDDYARSTS